MPASQVAQAAEILGATVSMAADRLVIQIELTRAGRPGTVQHHDAGIC
jgi:predicted short-subunit dehydrogenase-like oxidoreductase (DUF2520 family)